MNETCETGLPVKPMARINTTKKPAAKGRVSGYSRNSVKTYKLVKIRFLEARKKEADKSPKAG